LVGARFVTRRLAVVSGGIVRVLIVESTVELAGIWQRHLERLGARVELATSADAAVARLGADEIDVIVLDLILEGGGALAVADYAQYRRPGANVVFVTDTTFFSDGSIFEAIPGARALLQRQTEPSDLALIVRHYGGPAALM